MHSRPTILRAFAVVLVLRAAKTLPKVHPGWHRLLEREVQGISSDLEALIWAIGCAWAIRVERYIGKSRPGLNCVLLLTGLFLATHSLLGHFALNGAGLPNSMLPSNAAYGLFMLFLFLCVVVLVVSVTPGTATRRVFCAVVFPFLGLLGLLSVALGGDVVHTLILPGDSSTIDTLLGGPLFGLVVATVLSLPCVLLYREIAAPTAALALIPAFAKRLDAGGPTYVLGLHGSLFDQTWPFLCAFSIIGIFTHVCLIWVRRAPGEHASPAA